MAHSSTSFPSPTSATRNDPPSWSVARTRPSKTHHARSDDSPRARPAVQVQHPVRPRPRGHGHPSPPFQSARVRAKASGDRSEDGGPDRAAGMEGEEVEAADG